MARWFFMTAITGRYTGSPETAMESDLARLRAVKNPAEFVNTLEQIIKDTFTEDFWNIALVNSLETSSARTPVRFAYEASLNLLDAVVLFSKMKVSELLDPVIKPKKLSIERHHLFPKGYLKSIGITEVRDTNQLANYALIEWEDNIDISDKSPAEYFPLLAKRFKSDELRQMIEWHGLPKGWETMQYTGFITERRKLIAKVIRNGFEKLSATEGQI